MTPRRFAKVMAALLGAELAAFTIAAWPTIRRHSKPGGAR